MQDVSGEYLEMVQESHWQKKPGRDELLFMRCRSLPEFLAAQSALLQENLELTVSNSRRLAEISARLSHRRTQTFFFF